jgi:uncharacterized membrane protein
MNIQSLKDSTRHSLENADYNPRKLALLHAGVALGVSLILTILQFVLARGIDSTGGLSGIGLRTILSTAQMMLSTASLLLLPFWEMGFFRASMHIARGEPATPATLLEGLRRFMLVMRLFLIQALLYLGLMLLCVNIASTIFMLTPFSQGLTEQLTPLVNDPVQLEQALSNPDFIAQLFPSLIPMYVIVVLVFGAFAIPLFYRFRLSQFVIMDDPQTGAFAAMRISNHMMKNNCISLFKLDLHFWWFYLAQILLAVVAYLDVLLPMVGIVLPIHADVSFFLFYIIHISLSLLLAWQYTAGVQTTYAHFYLSKKPTE